MDLKYGQTDLTKTKPLDLIVKSNFEPNGQLDKIYKKMNISGRKYMHNPQPETLSCKHLIIK